MSAAVYTSTTADLPIFRYADRDYTFRELLSWADVTGRLEQMLGELCRTQRGVDGTQDIDTDRLQQASDSLRYRLGLITAESTSSWLRERRLQQCDLYRHLFRVFCCDPMGMAMDIREWCQVVPDVFHELWAELHFSGQFDVIVEEFLFRVAAFQKNGAVGGTAPPPPSLDGTSHFFQFILAGQIDQVCLLESAYLAYAECVTGYDTLLRRMKSQRLGLLHIEYNALIFDDLDTALEAFACLRYDHEDPYDLAARADVRIHSGSGFIEDLPEPLGHHLRSAQIGEYLEPAQLDARDDYMLCWLRSKAEPHISMPAVAERLRRGVLTEVLRSEIESRLSWLSWNRETDA